MRAVIPALIRALIGAAALFAGIAFSATPTLMPPEALSAPDRFIVVTISNPQPIRSGAVGGTVRGYQGSGGYRASAAAVAVVKELSRDFDLTSVSEWPIEQLQVHCIVFKIAEGATREDVLDRLRRSEHVIIAQPLNVFASASSGYDDPYAKLQENVRALDVQDAHRFSRGHGIRVAVIDTGIDLDHPDLAGRAELGGNYVDAKVESPQGDRHGTQVAGLIAAAANNGIGIVGVAPEVKVLAFKACWHDPVTNAGRCNSFTLAQALAGAIAARAHVINLSLVGPADPLLTALVEKAIDAKTIVVGAAGREGAPASFPAGLEHVLAVAEAEAESVETNARLLRAPGRDIVTLVPQGHYDFASGSSLATAQVTGVVALLLERNRRLTASELFEILRTSMDAKETARGIVRSVNACKALSLLIPRASCPAEE